MLIRSAYKPIYVGLGTAAIMAMGAGPVWAEPTPTPSPSTSSASPTKSPTTSPTTKPAGTPTKSPTTQPNDPDPDPPKSPTTSPSPPPVPVLHVGLPAPTSKVFAGESFTTTIHVYADKAKAKKAFVHVSASSKAKVSPGCATSSAGCSLGTLDISGKYLAVTVKVPANIKAGTIALKATATADKAQAQAAEATVTVNKKLDPEPKPTKTPNNNGGSGGGTTTPPPTNPNSTANPLPSAQTPSTAPLPPINQPQAATPSVAPSTVTDSPQTRLRSGNSAAPQELTFERLASTQIAWLTVLLVAFSLLITQLRLTRLPVANPRPKGDHRRPRRGLHSR